MFPYWILFSLYAAGALNSQGARRARATGPLFVLAGLAVALLIGLRFEVGGDWNNYVETLEVISYEDLRDTISMGDPGYVLLNWIVGRLGFGIWAVNLVCGLIFAWGLSLFARTQPNPWLVYVVAIPYLVIVVAMGYTRQGVAIALLMAGLSTLDRGSLLRFGICLAVAATFHKTAIIVVPLVGFAVIKRRLPALLWVMLTGVILYYAVVEASIDRMVTVYVEEEYQAEGAAIRVAMNMPPAILFLLFQKRFLFTEMQRKLWRNFSVASFGALLLLFVLSSSVVVDRLALYLIPLQLVILSRLPVAFPNRGVPNSQIVLLVIAYSALVQFVWLTSATHADSWLPYQFYPLAAG